MFDLRASVVRILCGALIGLGAAAFAVYAAVGGLDPTFDGDGTLITTVGQEISSARSVVIQSDGKIVAAGVTGTGSDPRADFALVRYNPDGSLDSSFDGDGIVTTDFFGKGDEATAVAIQPDGKIVAAGRATEPGGDRFAIARYNVDGSLDATFDGDGLVTVSDLINSTAFALAIQPDGNLLTAGVALNGGSTDFAFARHNTNGSLDPSFGNDGLLIVSISDSHDQAHSLAILEEGRILAGGSIYNGLTHDIALVRLDENGMLDTSFGVGGVAVTAIEVSSEGAKGLAIQGDGKILAAGQIKLGLTNDIGVFRYNEDGSLDRSFDSDGIVITDLGGDDDGNAVAIQKNGKIVVAGSAFSGLNGTDFMLARYDPDGTLDPGYGESGTTVIRAFGVSEDHIFDVVLDEAERAVAVGNAGGSFAAARVLGDQMTRKAPFDYDADGRTDFSVFRPSDGAWYLQKSTEGFFGMQFGFAADRIAPADYDGDGKTDIAIFRPTDLRWYIANSSNGTYRTEVYGLADDLPAPGDYDGDGKADLCVFRPSDGTWYLQRSSNGSFFAFQFGGPNDKPTVGDFDGDGKSDFAIFRTTNGEWYQHYSSDGSIHGEQFGFTTDRLAYADYDGDGKTDLAIFRPDTRIFYIKNSSTSTYDAFFFGLSEDIPTPGDYDGDGKADLSVFRPSDGNWYRQNSSNGSFNAFQFGLSGDRPTPTAYQ